MINTMPLVMNAWYDLLNGRLTNGIEVFRVDAPPGYMKNYVLLRQESNTDARPNNHHFVSNPVIITEVVTRFSTRIDDGVVDEIDNEISLLLYSNPATHNLPAQAGIGITFVRRQNATYLPEDDGTFRYMRLITRNVHRVEQLITA